VTPDEPLRDILRVAIQRENEACALYERAARAAETLEAQRVLRDLASQEAGHRRRLQVMLRGDRFAVTLRTPAKRVEDLGITDYLVEAPLAPDSDLQEILIVAGKREKGSHDLYAALGQVAEEEDARALFALLASEELSHKQRIEALYEQLLLTEN
jgi:rubrerythrin